MNADVMTFELQDFNNNLANRMIFDKAKQKSGKTLEFVLSGCQCFLTININDSSKFYEFGFRFSNERIFSVFFPEEEREDIVSFALQSMSSFYILMSNFNKWKDRQEAIALKERIEELERFQGKKV